MPKIESNKKTFSDKKSKIPRPLNSFMIFRMEHQASVSMEFPGATHQEISKKLSKKWKELDPEKKKVYTDKAVAAKEEHKLLYPDYKYCPRRRDGPPKGTKKPRATKSNTEGSQTKAYFQFKQHSFGYVNENESVIDTAATLYPLPVVDAAINQTIYQNDPILFGGSCFDTTFLHPAVNEPFCQDPSSSPSAFSMISQLSRLSPSLSSEYEPSVHPYYYYGQSLNNYIPSPYQCISNAEYQQIEPAMSFSDYNALDPEFYIPSQITYPANRSPPEILSHTQHTEESITQSNDFSSSFKTPGAPLLTQPFVYTGF
ncbi:hypothetical protein [Parasitella parasitica]|uniref:HMG box domain-containing protein n=1 Tax=Parasitella parasitica TaxID=35722 RepID=A0A0B7NA19_9FUNG|nr:hypothetical protein [Parasitella parasitica]